MELERLKDPLPENLIEWRIGQLGKGGQAGVWAKALCYLTSRAVHERFDDVCGVGNWQLRYKEHHSGTICEIGVKIDDEWVWKAGGADSTDIEAFKGGLSSAEKRAAVPWGVGRYLYRLEANFVEVSLQKRDGWKWQGANSNKGTAQFWWKPPQLPAWALPDGATKQKPASQNKQANLAQSQVERPYKPEAIRSIIVRQANDRGDVLDSEIVGVNDKGKYDKRGILAGIYSRTLGDNVSRYEVFEYIFGKGKRSTKELTNAEVLELLAHHGHDAKMAEREIKSMYKQSQKDKGQMELA